MEKLIKKHAEKLRFGAVGGANTFLDFGILFILVSFGLDKLVANFISTSIAFLFSFFLNKSFTFKAKSGNAKKQFALFMLVTLFGLWFIQPVILTSVAWAISGIELPSSVVLLVGKLLATVVTLIWNYILYAKYVFKKEVK